MKKTVELDAELMVYSAKKPRQIEGGLSIGGAMKKYREFISANEKIRWEGGKYHEEKGKLALEAGRFYKDELAPYERYWEDMRPWEMMNAIGIKTAGLDAAVYEESVRRGYHFDRSKIGAKKFHGRITETKGQLLYEWGHLKRKLSKRDTARHRACRSVSVPEHHPLFRLTEGDVRPWEKQH